jgi:hypothetical protein
MAYTSFKGKGYLHSGEVTKLNGTMTKKTKTSNIHFFEVDFSPGARRIVLPKNFVLKTTLPSFKNISEALFYFWVDGEREIPVPKCFGSGFSVSEQRSHILLEETSGTHHMMKIVRSEKQCRQAVDNLAKLHAYFWDNPKLKEIDSSDRQIAFLKGDFKTIGKRISKGHLPY